MKPKILLVDDEVESLNYLIDFLSDYYEVTTCNCADNFLIEIEKKSFDLFLLDINMPKTTGLELCKILKSNEKYKYIPVIFVTAFSDIERIEHGFKIGAVDYITKPYKLQELKIRVDTHYKNSKENMRLRLKHLELNEDIKSLTKELLIAQNKILSEEGFKTREDSFKNTNEKIEKQKIMNESFSKKFKEIQKKLEKQKELLKNTKNLLNSQ